MRIRNLIIDECTEATKGAVQAAVDCGVPVESWLGPDEVDAELGALLAQAQLLIPEWDHRVREGRRAALVRRCNGIFVVGRRDHAPVERDILRMGPGVSKPWFTLYGATSFTLLECNAENIWDFCCIVEVGGSAQLLRKDVYHLLMGS